MVLIKLQITIKHIFKLIYYFDLISIPYDINNNNNMIRTFKNNVCFDFTKLKLKRNNKTKLINLFY